MGGRGECQRCSLTQPATETIVTSEQLKAFITTFEAAVNSGRDADADALFTPHFLDHDPWPGHTPDVAGFKAGLAELRQGFPDLSASVLRTVSEGDFITVQFRLSGTQLGEFMGAPASGKTFSIAAIDINRISDGRIAEHWGVIDAAGMMEQLGA